MYGFSCDILQEPARYAGSATEVWVQPVPRMVDATAKEKRVNDMGLKRTSAVGLVSLHPAEQKQGRLYTSDMPLCGFSGVESLEET